MMKLRVSLLKRIMAIFTIIASVLVLKEKLMDLEKIRFVRVQDVIFSTKAVVEKYAINSQLYLELSRSETNSSVGSVIANCSNNAPVETDIKRCVDIHENGNLVGHLSQAVLLLDKLSEDEVTKHLQFLSQGGHWKPADCAAVHKVAVIIPFRDRHSHLVRLIEYIVPIMKRQLLDFRFVVSEQYGKGLFNKGRIMNAAFVFAESLNVDCVIFHDVDMFPQDDRIPYGCPDSPSHIGAFVNTLGYELWYNEIVGGALAIRVSDYRAVNGYSNMFWAWGGEDDDMGARILSFNFTIERPNSTTARFTMLKHTKRTRTAPNLVYKLLDSARTRWKTDGVNFTHWKVLKMIVRPLYYHLYVDVGEAPQEWRGA